MGYSNCNGESIWQTSSVPITAVRAAILEELKNLEIPEEEAE
jgi:hypothetical protein